MKHEHKATIAWRFSGLDFVKGNYSREHTWSFDGGIVVPASPSPSIVPLPWSNEANVDPEEAFVAAISSCHMLTFLWLASRESFQVNSYKDAAVGALTKNELGVYWVSTVTLRPEIVWTGDKIPTTADLNQLHQRAHKECFIANSVKTQINVEPTVPIQRR